MFIFKKNYDSLRRIDPRGLKDLNRSMLCLWFCVNVGRIPYSVSLLGHLKIFFDGEVVFNSIVIIT